MNGTMPAPYKRVLAAVDLGAATRTVVKRTCALSGCLGARVHLIHVHEGLPGYAREAILEENLKQIREALLNQARRYLATLSAEETLVDGAMAYLGRPFEKILQVADESEAGLIVVGAYQRRGIVHLFRTCSDQLLHRADRDLLVVKYRRETESEAGRRYQRILLAADLGPHSERAFHTAVAIARACGAALELVHVIEHFPVDRSNEDIAPEDRDPLHYSQEHAETALAALSAEANLPDLQARVVVSDGTAKREVAAIAAEHGCDLVVVGSHGHHGIEAMLGSTAIGVVHRAGSDVLVVRAGADA